MGFEPTAFRATIWRANQLRYTHHVRLIVSGGIRTPDPRLRRPLLYPAELRTRIPYILRKKAGDGNRTHVSSLEGWCSTIELHPHVSLQKIKPTAFYIIEWRLMPHESGWQDLNLRPPEPKSGALAKLSHTPMSVARHNARPIIL